MKYILLIFIVLTNLVGFSQDLNNLEKEISNKINSYRKKINKNTFAYNNNIVESCRTHSQFMGKNNTLVHVKNLSDANAEIIQMNYTNDRTNSEVAEDVLNSFLNSPPHKKVIESNYSQISVGIYITTEQDLWVTVRFN